MFHSIFKPSSLLFSLVCTSFVISAKAASFTPKPGVYRFFAEYEGLFVSNKAGEKGKVYGQALEIDNTFGLTKNNAISLDLFARKKDALRNEDDDDNTTSTAFDFQFRHISNFNINSGWDFGIENRLIMLDDGNGQHSPRWGIRAMIRNDVKGGFYKSFRAELAYRRNFQAKTPDAILLDIRAKASISQNIDFLARVQLSFDFASQEYINNNPIAAEQKNINPYSFKTLKIGYSNLLIGPEFGLPNKATIHAYYKMQLDASPNNKNYAKGFVIGYTQTF